MSDEPTATPPDSDDDLAALPAPSRPKSPLVALAVIALGAVLVWHLRHDVAFALSSRHPVDLGDARSLGARLQAQGADGPVAAARAAGLDDNRYVTIAGQAERRYALYIEPRGERARQTLFRLLGAGAQLFVRADDTTGRSDLPERWTGRLRRFDAVPWATSLRQYYATETQVTRYLALDGLHATLAGGGGALRDRMGGAIDVATDAPVVVDVAYPGELKVYLSKDKLPSLADARHELERMKLQPSTGVEAKDEWVFVVPMPEARKNEIINALSDKELAFQPRDERYQATRGLLVLDGDTLVVGDQARVPWAQVRAVGVPAPVVIGPDAFILVEGEAPSQLWWAPLLCLLLIAFAGFNVWYLARKFRARA
jgi:hypothetical protein